MERALVNATVEAVSAAVSAAAAAAAASATAAAAVPTATGVPEPVEPEPRWMECPDPELWYVRIHTCVLCTYLTKLTWL